MNKTKKKLFLSGWATRFSGQIIKEQTKTNAINSEEVIREYSMDRIAMTNRILN